MDWREMYKAHKLGGLEGECCLYRVAASTSSSQFIQLVTPFFVLVFQSFLHFGPNKQYYEGVDTMTDREYLQSVIFTVVVGAVVLVVLVASDVFARRMCGGLNLWRVCHAVFRRHLLLLAWGMAASCMFGYCVRLKHSGLDPNLQFGWLKSP
mmetsp:Transcript_30907/g.71229  ORF Transcript_30907/g.71229 Transcript_30907/m.71229 type:complete len:152 (+) Transcript_30907:3-458(+)